MRETEQFGHALAVSISPTQALGAMGHDAAARLRRAAPAAAVGVLRPGRGGMQVLLVRRRRNTAFGGAWVFPGGAVDAIDSSEDAEPAAAAANAAVRELAEETGVIAAVDAVVPLLGPVITADADRGFAVWFFSFRADPPIEVRLNEAELTGFRWLTPRDALARSTAGALCVPPATRAALTALTNQVDAFAAQAVHVLRHHTDGDEGQAR